MWASEDPVRISEEDETIPVDPGYKQSADFLIHHPAFRSLTRVWHWDPEGHGDAYLVHLKSAELGSFFTKAHIKARDAIQEALQWLEKQEKDLENPT